MIVACPECRKSYRVDESRLPSGQRQFRCKACRHVFAFEKPAASVPGVTPSPTPGAPAASLLAVVADEPREFRDLVCRTLAGLGCRVETTPDGEEAFRFAVARKPALMVLNVYLRKLLGVAVCEGVKGSPDLRRTRVVLVGSVFKSDRFVRGPRSLYGADDYFEDVIPENELLERLRAVIAGRGHRPDASPTGPSGATTAPAATPSPQAPRTSTAKSPVGTGTGAGAIEPHTEIRRLARIMLSDLRIYYPDRFEKAIAERRFFETFREEMSKGKELIHSRFPQMPDRIQVLAAALRDELQGDGNAERKAPAGQPA